MMSGLYEDSKHSKLTAELSAERLDHDLARLREKQLHARLKSCETALEERDAKISSLQTLAGATEVVQGLGYSVMPNEPTEVMVTSGIKVTGFFHLGTCCEVKRLVLFIYKAMLSAKGGGEG